MELLNWNDDKMGVGIKLIDNQHKKLLEIINKLATSINKNSQKNDLLPIVNELVEYASYHFTTEEELFDKFNYAESEAHISEHTHFIEKFLSMKNKILINKLYREKSAVETAEDIFIFLTNWFIEHVVGTDRKYVVLFKENGIE